RERILTAMLKLIVMKGLHAVTVAEIAKAANVGIGTIYKHFKNKEDIVQQLWIFQKEDESAYIFTNYNSTGTVKACFWFLWDRVIRYYICHKDEYYFSYHFTASPVLTEKIHAIAMKDFLAFDEMLGRGVEEGLFKKGLSARQLRLYTYSTINGWILWSYYQNMKFTDKNIDQFITMAWDAIRK
ncbi:hypothetical protein LCGC14_2216630, partial [marine sediment metagenome]